MQDGEPVRVQTGLIHQMMWTTPESFGEQVTWTDQFQVSDRPPELSLLSCQTPVSHTTPTCHHTLQLKPSKLQLRVLRRAECNI